MRTGRFDRRRTLLRAAPVLGAFCGAVGLVLAGVRWGSVAGVRELWFGEDAPWGATRIGLHRNELLVLTAQALLVGSWLVLGLLVRRSAAGSSTVLAATTAGAVPLLGGAPLFSNDAYTYVAVGELVATGHDPYRLGWAALHRPDYLGHVDLTWQHSPSPYSPLLLRLLELDARATGGDLLAGVVVLRIGAVLAFAGLGVAVAWAVSDAARPLALWLTVGNPLLIQHLLSGVHVDVYGALLLVLAVTAHARGRAVLAVVAVVLAAQVKVTAVVVLAVLAADIVARGPRARSAWQRAAAVSGGGLAGFAALSAASGLGFGWLRAVSLPALGRNLMTPVQAANNLAHRTGILRPRIGSHGVAATSIGLRDAGLALAAVAVVTAALLVRRLGVPLAAGAALAALCAFGPAMWPWYLAPVAAMVALAAGEPAVGPAGGRRRGGLAPAEAAVAATVAVSVVLAFALKPGSGPVPLHAPLLADLATLALLAGLLALTGLASLPGGGRRPAGRSVGPASPQRAR